MNIELKRKVHVDSYEAIMEIGIESDRNDILAVLELGRNRKINPIMVNEELVFRPENSSHGMRILEVIESYELITKSSSGGYDLTPAGINTLKNKKVKIPEKGNYILYLTDDPLLPDCILRYDTTNKEPWQEFGETRQNFYDKYKDKNKKQNSPKGIPKPECLIKYEKGSVVKLVGKSNEEIQINEIGDTLFKVDSTLNVSVIICLAEQNTSVKVVSDKKKKKEIVVDHTFTLKPIDVLNELFGNIQEVGGKLVLPVSYDEINDAEKSGMIKRDVIEKDKTINGYGKFSRINVDEITLIPKSKRDAENWAKWHLMDSINYYLDEKSYLTKRRDAAGKFIDFYNRSEIESALPDFDKFVEEVAEIEQKTAIYWYARAPIDLNMG